MNWNWLSLIWNIHSKMCYLTHSHRNSNKHNIDRFESCVCVCFVCEEANILLLWLLRLNWAYFYVCLPQFNDYSSWQISVIASLNSCVAVFFLVCFRFGKIINLDSFSSSMIRVLCAPCNSCQHSYYNSHHDTHTHMFKQFKRLLHWTNRIFYTQNICFVSCANFFRCIFSISI